MERELFQGIGVVVVWKCKMCKGQGMARYVKLRKCRGERLDMFLHGVS